MDYLKVQLFESQIKDVTDRGQILLLAESAKVKYWWLSFFIGGFAQMIQGRVGRGIGILIGGFFVGCISFFLFFLFGVPSIIFAIWVIYDAYSFEKDTNNYIDLAVNKRLQALNEDEEV